MTTNWSAWIIMSVLLIIYFNSRIVSKLSELNRISIKIPLSTQKWSHLRRWKVDDDNKSRSRSSNALWSTVRLVQLQYPNLFQLSLLSKNSNSLHFSIIIEHDKNRTYSCKRLSIPTNESACNILKFLFPFKDL